MEICKETRPILNSDPKRNKCGCVLCVFGPLESYITALRSSFGVLAIKDAGCW